MRDSSQRIIDSDVRSQKYNIRRSARYDQRSCRDRKVSLRFPVISVDRQKLIKKETHRSIWILNEPIYIAFRKLIRFPFGMSVAPCTPFNSLNVDDSTFFTVDLLDRTKMDDTSIKAQCLS